MAIVREAVFAEAIRRVTESATAFRVVARISRAAVAFVETVLRATRRTLVSLVPRELHARSSRRVSRARKYVQTACDRVVSAAFGLAESIAVQAAPAMAAEVAKRVVERVNRVAEVPVGWGFYAMERPRRALAVRTVRRACR